MPFRKPGLKQIQFWVLCGQLLIFVVGFGVWTWFDFDEIEQQASEEVEAAGVLLEEHVLRSLAAIDSALLQTADLVNDIGITEMRSEAAWRRLCSIARPLPLSGAIFIYDLNGDTIAASSSYPTPVGNRADREYFQYLLAGKADQYIGKALQGRTVHQLFFPVARSIRAADGRLQAVAQVGVEVDYIADLFTKAELQGKTFALYRLSDGAVVARHPVTERLLDESISSLPFFAALSDGRPHWGGWVNADGNRVLLSARRVSELPLILTASMPHSGVFDHAYEQLRRRGLGLLVASGALMTLGVMLLRSAKREARIAAQQRRAENELREREEQLRLFVEHAPAAIAMFDREMRYVAVSRRWSSDYRLEEVPVLGRSHYEIFPEIPERWKQIHRRCLAGAVERAEEDRFERQNGRTQWLRWEVRPWLAGAGHVGGIIIFSEDITERKQAEEALRQKNVELAEAQHVAHIGSWFWDAQTDVTTGSDELLRIYGFDPATQSMPNFREQRGQCYPVEDWERVNAAVQTSLATGVGYELDVHAFRNGFPVWITTRGEVVRGADGRVLALRGTVQDITHRKAAEEALRESEERLRLLGDNLPDSALYQYAREPDGRSRFLYVSAGIERLNGVRVQDVLRDPGTLHRQIPPEYLTPILEKEAQAHRDLTDFDAEVPMRRPDGEVRWMRLHSRPRRMPDGRIIWDGVQTDITERKAAEEKLQNSERRFRALTEKASEIITILDAEGVITYTAGSSSVLGYADDELAGKTSFEFVHPDDQPHVAKLFLDGLTQPGKVEQAEFRFRAKDGSWRWLLAMGTNLLDVPYVGGILVNSRDISERKRAEEQLQRLNANLESAVRERTAELLAANRELAERAQQLRLLAGELTMAEQRERKQLAKILHDGLQQYLVAAKLQVGGLVSQIQDDEARQSALSAESLLGESIMVSRSLAAELSPPILHEAGILAGMEWLARWMANTHGLHVDLVVEMEPPVLSEDVKVLMFESVRELLLNVVKHAKTDSARVHLSQDDARHLRITVGDRGKGFDAAAAPHGRDGGGGFGLFSIRERIGLVGGRFEVDSSPGEGARVALIAPFTPRGPVEPVSTGLRTDTRGAAPSQPRQSGRIRILLTDDHAVMREGLARLLAQEPDFEVVGQASDGKQAVDKAAALLPDLILMDIGMPEMNGIEATRTIRRQHPDIAVIGLSLYSEEERGREMLEAGAAAYMSKSGPPADLKAAIRACWRARSEMRADAALSSKN